MTTPTVAAERTGRRQRAPAAVALAVYAAVVPFGSAIDVPIGVRPPFNTLSSLVGLAAIGAIVLHLALGRGAAPRVLPAVPVWLVFVAVCAFTWTWSVDRTETFDELVLLASILGLYLVTTLLPFDRTGVEWFEAGAVVGGALASAYGILLLATGNAPVGVSGVPRFGTVGNDDPNITAAAFLLPMLVAAGRALRATDAAAKAPWAVAAAVIGAGVLLTGSRGGMVAAAAGIVVLAAQGRRRVRSGPLVAAVVVAGLTFLLAPDGVRDRFTSTDSTGRTDVWRLGLRACDEHCVLGSGWGTFSVVYAEAFQRAPDIGGYRNEGFKAHNIWLQAVVEVGFAGLALAAAGFALAARDLARLPRALRGPPLAALVALAVSNSFVSNMAFKYFWLVFMYAAAATIAADADADAGADLEAAT